MEPATIAACDFYDTRYDLLFSWMPQANDRLELPMAGERRCRFCGCKKPQVTFRKVAHAIPESLGNRGLTSAYECDDCNGAFGRGIENDLGEWSKPMRTFARVKGKNGVPTMKEGPEKGWRIEYDGGFKIKAFEDRPIFDVDESNKRVVFTLKRGAYTPVAVFKAFVKIGLTLLPDSEPLQPFRPALAWIKEPDHRKSWLGQAPVIHTFQNGPMPPDRIVAFVLRRKPGVLDVPYAFLVIGYGNDVYQVVLPAPQEDAALNGTTAQLVPFPTPGGPEPAIYGRSRPELIDLTGREVVRGETVKVAMRYQTAVNEVPGASGVPK